MSALRSLYVAREPDGGLYLYPRKPVKSITRETWVLRKEHQEFEDQIIYLGCSKKIFSDVKWTDPEARRITGLEYTAFQKPWKPTKQLFQETT